MQPYNPNLSPSLIIREMLGKFQAYNTKVLLKIVEVIKNKGSSRKYHRPQGIKET